MLKALEVLKFIGIILEVLLIFNLVIIVHELGHFLAARWRGAVVEEFGVWFGKPLWRKQFGGVWYSLGSIPAGGFVKLPQMAPMETLEGESDIPKEKITPLRPLDKIIVAIAGPLFSFLLAITLACLIWAVGKPTSQPDDTTEVGTVKKGWPAEVAGFQPGDKIIAIDGKHVATFSGPTNSVMWGIAGSKGDTIVFEIERDGQRKTLTAGFKKEKTEWWKRDSLRQIGISPRFVPEVGSVKPGSLAANAGLQPKDIVRTANGQKIITIEQIEDVLKAAPTAPLALGIERPGSTGLVSLTLPPIPPAGKEEDDALIPGVEWGRIETKHPAPIRQVKDSLNAMRNMIGAVISKGGDVRVNQFSGPIGIMNVYRRILELPDGWKLALSFSVFFNVNLAIINMLPFPVLDGGHITLALIESARRRPVNARVLEMLQTACALLLMSFILYVTFFDVTDHFRKKKPAQAPNAEQPTISAPGHAAATPTPAP